MSDEQPSWASLSAKARHAHKRLDERVVRDRRKGEQFKDPDLSGIYQPTINGWLVLFTLAECGKLRRSHFTVPGATVSDSTCRALERGGLVVREDGWAYLTDAGAARAQRRW